MVSNKVRIIGIISGVFCVTMAFVCFFCARNVINDQKKVYTTVLHDYKNLFSGNKQTPREDLTTKDISVVKKEIEKISYPDEKEKLKNEIVKLNKYVVLRDKVNSYFVVDTVKSTTTVDILYSLKKENSGLSKKYQKLLKSKLENMETQINYINDLKTSVSYLFVDNTYQQVKDDITREMYNSVLLKQNYLKQQDIIAEQKVYLDRVNNELSRREEEAEKKKIQAAWKILDVPYISQNNNGVLNGCEVASLLMGLQYKGYLRNMDLATYAANVPKSSDPFSGFTYDIYGLEPTNVPHWIAPAPLAQYGRSSSSNNGVIDGTGRSLDELDAQIQSGNPVVIYLTAKFNTPKNFIENAPKNIHVLLLTGYNSITGEQIITDPWTHTDGRTKWIVSKQKVESIYNATGRRNVIIS